MVLQRDGLCVEGTIYTMAAVFWKRLQALNRPVEVRLKLAKDLPAS